MVAESPRVPTRQACDYCRLRKTKCEPLEDASKNICKLCSAGKLDCTYDIPVKRRGPPPKRRRIIVDSVNADAEHRPVTPGVARDVTTTPSQQDTPTLHTALPAVSPEHLKLSIDTICSRPVFDLIMQDFLDILYPLVPVVHRPSFLQDLQNQRHIYDQTFESFCFAICALVICMIPHKFDEYKRIDGSLTYASRREAVDHIHKLILQARQIDYFDILSREKWAISYMMSAANAHLGHFGRAKMLFTETNSICIEFGLHRISKYAGMDKIESQLRKKAFWLNFTSFSHLRARETHWDSLADRMIFDSADAELLMPLEVDDEFITAENMFLQPQGRPSVVVGFNALTRINNCLVSIIKDPALPLLSCDDTGSSHRYTLGSCECGRHIQPASLSSLTQARLRKVKHVLDDIPAELRTWSDHTNQPANPAESSILSSQYESMKANIHVTHLWIQSLLLERLITASGGPQQAGSPTHPDKQQIWEMREDICRQLLHILNNISQANIAPNGHFLIVKIREVAACLLDCPFEEEGHVSRRAKTYIQSFADVLTRLDNAYKNDYQQNVWTELEEQTRASPSTFWALSS